MWNTRLPFAAALALGLLTGPAAAVDITFDLAGLAGPVASPILVPGIDPTGALTDLELQIFGLATATDDAGEAFIAFQDLVLGGEGIGVTGPEATTEDDTPFVDAGIKGGLPRLLPRRRPRHGVPAARAAVPKRHACLPQPRPTG